MKKILSIIVVFLLISSIWHFLPALSKSKTFDVGHYYIEHAKKDTGAANVVTSIVLNFRGFDTLGEVTVLFLASLGIGFLFAGKKKDYIPRLQPSLILRVSAKILFPFLILFGAYIFIHGHLTPGGGFQGGAIIASAVLFLYLGSTDKRLPGHFIEYLESLSGLAFIGIGLTGIVISNIFLNNFLPKGVLYNLFSAGIIPILYIIIGIKVGLELSKIVADLIKGEDNV